MRLSAEDEIGPVVQLERDDNSCLSPSHFPVPDVCQPVHTGCMYSQCKCQSFTLPDLSITVTAHNMRKSNEENQDKISANCCSQFWWTSWIKMFFSLRRCSIITLCILPFKIKIWWEVSYIYCNYGSRDVIHVGEVNVVQPSGQQKRKASRRERKKLQQGKKGWGRQQKSVCSS